MEEILRLEGVAWLTRKAMMNAPSIYLIVTHDAKAGTITVAGEIVGMSGLSSTRHVDGKSFEEKHAVLGLVTMTPRLCGLSDVDEDYLKDAWKDLDPETKLINTYYKSIKGVWAETEVRSIRIALET